jgi:branched-chain amino acid transport system permease protein
MGKGLKPLVRIDFYNNVALVHCNQKYFLKDDTLATVTKPNSDSTLQNILQNKRLMTTFTWLAVAVVLLLVLREPLMNAKANRLISTLITGVLVGGVYALIALGIVVINKASGVFNFAHGHMMMLGGFIFSTFFSSSRPGIPSEATPDVNINILVVFVFCALTSLILITMNGWRALQNPRTVGFGVALALIWTVLMCLPGRDLVIGEAVFTSVIMFVRAITAAIVGSMFIGLLIERFAIRPLIGQPLFATVLITLAVAQVLQGIVNMIWGSIPVPLAIFAGIQAAGIPNAVNIDAESLGGMINIKIPLVITFVLALIAFVVFVLFFRYTSVGLAMRASAENQTLAQSIGLRVRFILAVAWVCAGVLATTSGVLQGGATQLDTNLPLLAFRAFPAVLLGGLESIPGALFGGIAIGIAENMSNYLFPGTNAGTELAPYLVLMIVLVIRPQGLFGEKIIERI